MKYTCKTCGKDREALCFSVHSSCKLGFDTSRCKPCKKAKHDWTQVPYEKRMLNRVASKCRKYGIEFNLELADIVFPPECPIFHKPFIYGDTDWTYSIDRIDPGKGYIKGNIQVISNRANMLKNNATSSELRLVADYMDKGNI